MQIVELADIARCIANASLDDERSLSYLVSCLEDLQDVINHRKHEALTVQTFGTRIEKLHRLVHLSNFLAFSVNLFIWELFLLYLDKLSGVNAMPLLCYLPFIF